MEHSGVQQMHNQATFVTINNKYLINTPLIKNQGTEVDFKHQQ